ncbi:response regulator receiver modulated metal-depenent phosphohydrolase [Geothrix limicola]|uniref:Response regulator receiver modulated metal-depenent phosphohydrolase n=1 Tax=Geothrix limicola TaxID=2927978 RepID=A0ABQ5QD38_9BACT|nr:HD domain-containing phosphohydrolase [Geothrix limicola]GLH71969.1 response regulator receiver modulated metal-depenent phosphohydrolase [Geothrix limicola]
MKPKVLLVDDEENILQAYTRVLRGKFDLDTALGGEAALERMQDRGPYAVVVSDMRMPGMDGVAFLAWAMAQHPDTVRIMLTGNADQGTAMEAVNKGAIFRFLTKPCDSELLGQTLDLAVRQHELITAEKTLLEDTLKGAIKMLVELLSCLDPISFGRAQAMAAQAEAIAREMGMKNPWVLGIASILSQIGILTVPEGVATKIQTGTFLNSNERDLANRIPEIGADLIKNIPRLEEVADAVLYMNKNFNGTGYPPDARKGEDIPLGGRILRAVWDYERLLPKFGNPISAVRDMESRTTWYDLEVLRAFGRCLERQGAEAPPPPTREISLHELRIGQVLVTGIETMDGLLVVPQGTTIGLVHLQKLRNFARLSGLREPLVVTGG